MQTVPAAPKMEKLSIFCPSFVLRTQKLGQQSPVAQKSFTTILFADISGFTKLSAQLNSEELKKHINDYFSIMVSVVFANGGDVIKFCGDAILIMWTVPVSSERGLKAISVTMACICALQLLKECGRYNCINKFDHASINLNLHCGISCGEAFAMILGDECRREFLISGDILSRVGRVEATAKAGEACVCTRVRELVGDKLSCTPVVGDNGAFKLSGKLAQELTSTINSHVAPSHSKSNLKSNSSSVRRSNTSNGDANDDARDDEVTGGGGGRELELTRMSFFNDQLANSIAAFSLAALRHSYSHRDSGPATRRLSAAPLPRSSTSAVRSDQSHVPRPSHTSSIDLSSSKTNQNPPQESTTAVYEHQGQRQLGDPAHAMNTVSVSVSTKPRANSVTTAAMNIFRRASLSTLSSMLGLGSAAVIPCVDDDDNDNDHQPRVVNYEAQATNAREPIAQSLLFAKSDNDMGGVVDVSHNIDVNTSHPQPRPRDLHVVKDKEGTVAVGVLVAPRRFSFMMMMMTTNKVETDQGHSSSTGSSSKSSEGPRQSFSEIADLEGDAAAAGAVPKYRRHSAGRLKSILLREDDPDVVAMRQYMEQTARLESLNAPRADTVAVHGGRVITGVGVGVSRVAGAAMPSMGPVGTEGHKGDEDHDDHLESTKVRVRCCSEESATSTSTNRCAAVSPEGASGRHTRNLTQPPMHSRDEISTSEIDSKLFVNAIDDVELQSALQGSGRLVGEENDLCSSEDSAGAGPRQGEGSCLVPPQGDAARPTRAPPSLTNYLRSFVHESARSAIASNTLKLLSETRSVATVFIKINEMDADGGCTSVSTSSSFTEVSSRRADPCDQPQAVLMAILSVTRTVGGSLRQFVLDDKGWVAIVCFGVPGASYDNDCMKAIEASLAIRSSLAALGHHSDIGVAYGKAYCGLVGSVMRCEYTVMGASVNLSSRLMGACEKTFGPPGGILIDPEVNHRVHNLVSVVHAGSIFAKGYSAPLDTFTVIGKRCFRASRLVEIEGFPEAMSCLDSADDGLDEDVFDCGRRDDSNGSVLQQSAGRRGSVLQRLSVLDSIDLVVLKAAAVLGAEEVQQRRVDGRERPAMISLQLLLPTLNGIGVDMTAQDLMSIVLRLASAGFLHAMNSSSSPSSLRVCSPHTVQKRFGDVVGIDWELQEQLYECQLTSQRTLTHRIAGALLEDLYRQSDARKKDISALLKRSIAHLIMSDCPFTMKMDRLQAAVAIALSEHRCSEAIQHLENMIMCVCGLNIEGVVALCCRCFPMSTAGGNEKSTDDSQSLIDALAVVCDEKYALISDMHMPFTEAAAVNGFGLGHVLRWLYAVGEIRHSRLKVLSGLQLMALSARLRGFSMIPYLPNPPSPSSRCVVEGGVASSSVAPSNGEAAIAFSHKPLVDKMRTDSMIASPTQILGLRYQKQPPSNATTVTTPTTTAATRVLGRLLSFSPFAIRSRDRHSKAKEKISEAVVSIEGLNKWLALIEAVATELILRSHNCVAKVVHLLEQGLLICDDCISSAATGPSSSVVSNDRDDMFVDVQGIDEEFHSSTAQILSRRNSFLALLSVAYCSLSHCQSQPLCQAFQCRAATSLALAEALQTQAFSPRALAVLAACKGWRMAHEGLMASAAESFRTASAQFALMGDTESEQRCAIACAWMYRLGGKEEQSYSSLLDPLRQELSVRLGASKDNHVSSSSLPTSSLLPSLSLLDAVARFDMFAAVLDGNGCDDDAPGVACRRFDSIMRTRSRNKSKVKPTLLDVGSGEAFEQAASADDCAEWIWSSISLLGQGRNDEARSPARRALAGVGVWVVWSPSFGVGESRHIDTPGPGRAYEEGDVLSPLGLMARGWEIFLLLFVNLLVARQGANNNDILTTSSTMRGAGAGARAGAGLDDARLLEEIKTHFDSLGAAAAHVSALRPLYGLVSVMVCTDLCDVEMPTAGGDLWQHQDRGCAPMNGDANEFIDTADDVKSWTMASWVADNEPAAGRQLCCLVGCWSCQVTRLESWCCAVGGGVAHMIDGGLVFAMKQLHQEGLRMRNNKRNNGTRLCSN